MITELRDAIAAALNEADLGQTFTAAAEWAPSDKLDNNALRVLVVHAETVFTRSDRGSRYKDHTFHIGIQKKLTDTAAAAVDPFVALLEGVDNHLETLQVLDAGGTPARWKESAIVTTSIPEQLRQLRQQTAVLAVTYRTL